MVEHSLHVPGTKSWIGSNPRKLKYILFGKNIPDSVIIDHGVVINDTFLGIRNRPSHTIHICPNIPRTIQKVYHAF